MKKIFLILILLLLVNPALADELVQIGATSVCTDVFISDSSSSTGEGLTGLAYNTGSLTAYYHKSDGSGETAITLATMTLGTFTSSGFVEIDATNMPGWYQLCPPNAAFSSGRATSLQLKGAANMAPMNIRFILIAATPDVNVSQISGDSTAADNLEAAYDGAGYAGGTIKQQVNTVAISGDTTAADNAELFYDGTGYNAANSTVGVCTALGTGGIEAQDVSTGAAEKIADIAIRRTTANVEASSFGDAVSRKSIYGAVARLTHKVKNESGSLKSYKADGTTLLDSQTITTDPSAQPITEMGN